MAMDMGIMVTDMEKAIMDINRSTMKIKTYVINLKDSVDRRVAVLAETAKYSFMDVELVEAIDGRKLKPEEMKACFNTKKFINRYFRTPRGGEIGCTLSHRVCYRKLLESDEEFALILEDDVIFIYPEDVETTLKNILDVYKEDKPYFITLAYHFYYYSKKYRKLGNYTFYRIYDAYGTCAYLINRKAAKLMLSVAPPYIVADDYLFIRKRGILVDGVYPTLAVGASTKNMISTDIQQESVVSFKISHFRLLYNYYRIFCIKILSILKRMSVRHYRQGINE